MSYELILVMVLGLLDISVNLWRRIFEDRVYSEIERQSLQSLKLYLGVFFFSFSQGDISSAILICLFSGLLQ